jgi:hypothetical protein
MVKIAKMKEELHVVDERLRTIRLSRSDSHEDTQRFLRRFPEALVALDDSSFPDGAFSERVPAGLPDDAITAIRKKFGPGFLRTRFWWSFIDGIRFDPEAPVYDVEAGGKVYRWEVNIGNGALPVVYEPAVLRQLFRDIGLKVKLFWEPNGPRYFRLMKAEMEIELSEHFMSVPDSRHSRARSRDRD